MISHARFLKLGLDANPITATQLLNAYARSRSPNALSHAYQVFDQVSNKDTVLWSSIISAYTNTNNPDQALHLFFQMHRQHQTPPNHFVFATAARACALTSDLLLGETIHSCVIKYGCQSNVVVNTSILDMYAKCSVIDCSRKVFDAMLYRNEVSWNAMVAGYLHNGMEVEALELFYQMKCAELQMPDEFAAATVLTACAGASDLIIGAQIHGYLVRTGLESDHATGNAVCNMYFRCGEVDYAKKMVKGREGDVVIRLIMINGYIFNRRYHEAIKSIGPNFAEALSMDLSVVVPILTACANLGLFRMGRQIHGLITASINFRNCHLNDAIIIGSALIDMYCKCCRVQEARQVFDTLQIHHVSHWNSMIAGCIYNGLLDSARAWFDVMPERNVISWTAMMSGYVQHGLPQDGLALLAKMSSEGGLTQRNCFTFATALDACSLLTALSVGKQIHAQSIRSAIKVDTNSIVVETALVDMYSKSGNLNYAKRVFDQMGERNVVSWTSMITGYAVHGYGSQALECFERMLKMGVEPNAVTFVAVLSACSHSGLVNEGMGYFKLMREKYGIAARSDHYTCLVDLLVRAGKVSEAYKLMEEVTESNGNSQISKVGSTLVALLSGCQLQANVEMGRKVANEILERNQQVSETYIALSNIYASAGMWDEAYAVREEWKSRGVVKEPGFSQIQIGSIN